MSSFHASTTGKRIDVIFCTSSSLFRLLKLTSHNHSLLSELSQQPSFLLSCGQVAYRTYVEAFMFSSLIFADMKKQHEVKDGTGYQDPTINANYDFLNECTNTLTQILKKGSLPK